MKVQPFRHRFWRVSTAVALVAATMGTVAFTPLSSLSESPTRPVQLQTYSSTPHASPVMPSFLPVVDNTMQNPPRVMPTEPIRPLVRYNAYEVSGSGNWNHPVSDHTVEAGQQAFGANLNDPLYVANMEALRALGTEPTIRPDRDAVYQRADFLAVHPDELTAAATALQSQIVNWQVASSDQPFWMQTAITHGGPAQRPDLDNVRVDQPQGTFLLVTFDNGRAQKLRFESGLAPIIGIRSRSNDVSAVQSAAPGGPSPAPSNASYDPVWDRLVQCEASGNWAINTGNGFYGGLQFTPSTWRAFGGTEYAERADLASPLQQIVVATRTHAEQGWGAWPGCKRKLGLSAPPGPAPSLEPAPAPEPAPPAVQTVAQQTEAPPAAAGGSSASKAVEWALSVKDSVRYVFGGYDRSNLVFDCSSFTQTAYAMAGIDIPRTSRTQATAGTPVEWNDLQPGDLLFFYSPISHVGMYIGDGQMVHNSNPDTDARVSPLSDYYRQNFTAARRYV